jgi:hypothetical protein
LADDIDVAVRSLHDLDPLTRLRGEARGIARDHADRPAAFKDILEDLASNGARGCGDDDHMNLLRLMIP